MSPKRAPTRHPGSAAVPAFLQPAFGDALEHRIGAGRVEQLVRSDEFVERYRRDEVEQFPRAAIAAQRLDRFDQLTAAVEQPPTAPRLHPPITAEQRIAQPPDPRLANP